jgi:RNA polymerase-binding transcription factor DksA
VLEGLGDLERAEAVAIREAIRRIAAGTYDVCRSCGRLIEPPRLSAVPTADTCISCAT